ncbi:MAG: septum formation initiator family protein [Caulobacterales bacterium]
MGKSKSVALSIAMGGVIVYLSAHAVTGGQGLFAYMQLQAQEEALHREISTLEVEKAALEARAARMRPESLDLDYLDERARVLLAAGASDEIVFALDQR